MVVTRPLALRADCTRCTGLCCVAPAFAASADFAIDKPAGLPCLHLQQDFRCEVHDRLRPLGFRGCTVYDCFGAGQQVTQETLPGHDWRDPAQAQRVFAVFAVVRELHEMLWHLGQAAEYVMHGLDAEVEDARADVRTLAAADADALLEVDVEAARRRVGELLARISQRLRGGLPQCDTDLRGADLVGRDLTGRDLTGATARGAYLIAADLRGARMRATDLLGADLRDADVRGTDLSAALFLSQMQVNAARGDARTRVPPGLEHPAHWAASH